jgi:RimJ/RimL family protein N-acetyltransferase
MINNPGYRLSANGWGKSLATEFAACVMRYGVNDSKLTKISAVVRENHLASRNVLEKTGLRHSKDIHDDCGAHPVLQHSRINADFCNQVAVRNQKDL